MTRISIRNTEAYRLAALLRGDATWGQAVGTLRERTPGIAAWRSEIEALAKEPGRSERLPQTGGALAGEGALVKGEGRRRGFGRGASGGAPTTRLFATH